MGELKDGGIKHKKRTKLRKISTKIAREFRADFTKSARRIDQSRGKNFEDFSAEFHGRSLAIDSSQTNYPQRETNHQSVDVATH
jgi:hypothetical protein